jgi:nicotinate-nucleotide pyrophosphorylase (carboxylating)
MDESLSNKPMEPEAFSLPITQELSSLLSLSLFEDVGSGDVTSLATIPASLRGSGRLFSKESGVFCGRDVALRVAQLVDRRIAFEFFIQDGGTLEPGADIARLDGPLRSMLTAERVMLNFVQRMSGIATLTRRYVDRLRELGSRVEVVDTRKTTPLWRKLEKYAVRAGGGGNHRFALYDMYLVKNNHIDAAGGIPAVIRRIREHNEAGLKLAVEARNLDEVRQILEGGADLIMLDNMSVEEIREALRLIDGRAQTEITGGVKLDNLELYAGLAVDRISVGALTHSAPALDISLHVEQSAKKQTS